MRSYKRVKTIIGLALIILSFFMIFLVTVACVGWRDAMVSWAAIALIGAIFSLGLALIYKD